MRYNYAVQSRHRYYVGYCTPIVAQKNLFVESTEQETVKLKRILKWLRQTKVSMLCGQVRACLRYVCVLFSASFRVGFCLHREHRGLVVLEATSTTTSLLVKMHISIPSTGNY